MPYILLAILFIVSSQSAYADKKYEQMAIKKSQFNQMVTSKTDRNEKIKRIKKSHKHDHGAKHKIHKSKKHNKKIKLIDLIESETSGDTYIGHHFRVEALEKVSIDQLSFKLFQDDHKKGKHKHKHKHKKKGFVAEVSFAFNSDAKKKKDFKKIDYTGASFTTVDRESFFDIGIRELSVGTHEVLVKVGIKHKEKDKKNT